MVAKKIYDVLDQRSFVENEIQYEKSEISKDYEMIMNKIPFDALYQKIKKQGNIQEDLDDLELIALSGHIAKMIGVAGLIHLDHWFFYNQGLVELNIGNRRILLDLDSKVVIEPYDDMYDVITTVKNTIEGRTTYVFESGEEIEYPIVVPFSEEKSPILWVINGVYNSFTDYYRTMAADKRKRIKSVMDNEK